MPQLDLSWVITAVIAIVAFLSPVVVALINNHHSAKMKSMEFEHVEKLKQMEQIQLLTEKQFEIYYADKKSAFSDFIQSAGAFSMEMQSKSIYANLQCAINRALLFCNAENQEIIQIFSGNIDSLYGTSPCSASERHNYSMFLGEITLSLKKDLELSKPVTGSK